MENNNLTLASGAETDRERLDHSCSVRANSALTGLPPHFTLAPFWIQLCQLPTKKDRLQLEQ